MRSWTSLLVFLSIVLSIVGGVHYYLYARLLRAPGLESLARYGGWFLAASALLLPAAMIGRRFLPRASASVVASIGYTWMGFLILAFFLTLGAELIRVTAAILSATNAVPLDEERRTFLARAIAGGVGVATLGLATMGLASVRAPVKVKPVKIALSRFPAALDGFRIVQLSDVHVGPTIDGSWLREVVDRVNALEPDLIAITGDLVDGSVEELREHVAPLAELRAAHGVYFVTGNHEYYSGPDAWIAELRRLGITVLRNQHVSIGDGADSFDLAGVDDYKAASYGRGHGADVAKAVSGRDPARELILLAHQPKQAFEAAQHGVGLQLSGHTHGGQIFPWGLFVKLDQKFVRGIDRVGDLIVYTSCGTGYWGPPMRVGAPAEITEIALSRAS